MTRTNRLVVAGFLGSLVAFPLLVVAWDIVLYRSAPEGLNSISWGMALLGSSPLAVFALGHATGGVLWGLAAHFWAGQMAPAYWDELVALRAAHARPARPAPRDDPPPPDVMLG